MHQLLAATLDTVFDEIAEIQRAAREGGATERPRWPMIVLRTPKGWTGPKEVDGAAGGGHLAGPPGAAGRGPRRRRAPGGSWRSGCAPTGRRSCSTTPARPRPESSDWLPRGDLRMGANPHANGGRLPRDLELPDFRDYAVKVDGPAHDRRGDPGARRLAARRA